VKQGALDSYKIIYKVENSAWLHRLFNLTELALPPVSNPIRSRSADYQKGGRGSAGIVQPICGSAGKLSVSWRSTSADEIGLPN
jgi:hypothetical protein